MDSDDEDTKHNNKKKKPSSRKRLRTSNPLSHARGKQQSHENIWFRRIGAGYHLFTEYYAGQPMGTVCSTKVEVEGKEANTASRSSQNQGGAGLSRAAKRRKKKKQKNNSANDITEPQEHDNSTTNPSKETPKEDYNTHHPLLQALSKQSSDAVKASLRCCFQALAKQLSVTFRLRRCLDHDEVEQLKSLIQKEFQFLVKPLPFGDGYLYQAKCSKQELNQKYVPLKSFLLDHSQDGTVARQEIGSMLPLLALEQAGCLPRDKKCRILDVCASPGSKTLQALELVHGKSRILANDVSEARLQSLKDAMERSGMPASLLERIGYTCEDARILSTSKPAHVVVCDVPCSGDGTVRKDAHILELWKPSQGNVLHSLQLQILVRALTLVAVGGVVCYSTCSLNPIENEAVVAAALKQLNSDEHQSNHDGNLKKQKRDSSSKPTVELLEFPNIPGFQRRPGISSWRVADYQEERSSTQCDSGIDVSNYDDEDDDEIPHLVWHDSYQDAMNLKMENAVSTMWCTEEDNIKLHLDRCTRLWPQDHDAGGFFLALLRRNS